MTNNDNEKFNFMVNERNASGFFINFDNGYSVSVQWGPGCYCSNNDAPYTSKNLGSMTAEVAVLYDSKIVGDVMPYRTSEQVATTIYNVSQRRRPYEGEDRKEFEESQESA
jgi:hypothetical protein